MSLNSTFEVPSPVGGIALTSDFVPSIIFAVMYGLLVPVIFYRLISPKSRNVMLLGTSAFAVERVVIFSLRAVQSRNEEKRNSKSLTTYMQVTIGMGFISVAQDLVNLLRVLLVKSTNGLSPAAEQPNTPGTSSFPSRLDTQHNKHEPLAQEDNPRLRYIYRRVCDFLNVAFLAAIVPGIIANSTYSSALTDQMTAQKVMRLRYISTSVATVLIIVIMASAWWCMDRISPQRRNAAKLLIIVGSFLLLPAIYRLAVMYNQTTSLTSISPSSLNTPVAKGTFYGFHMVPEWITISLLLGLNVREMFDTGPFGDWRVRDETREEREKREAKAAKKAAKLNAANMIPLTEV